MTEIEVPPAPARAELERLLETQRAWHHSARSDDPERRIDRLRRLSEATLSHRDSLKRALHADFGKAPEEVDLTEIVPVLMEIRHALRNVRRWMSVRSVSTPLPLFGTSSEIRYEPKGVVLILSPWNYPVNLTLGPLVSALAAGNTAILKPSELTPRTSEALAGIIERTFERQEVALVQGDSQVGSTLTGLPFDHIFFTGSPRVGRMVMESAAENLTPVTLELGGKSPALIDDSADLEGAARAVAWGALLNAGQTCIAPDYALVADAVEKPFLNHLKAAFEQMYGRGDEDGSTSPDLCRMVTPLHARRMAELITDAIALGAHVVTGGGCDEPSSRVAPTILTNVSPEARVMREEIFGPLLPVIPYASLDDALTPIGRLPPPLALYIFSEDQNRIDAISRKTRSGAIVVNDVAIQFVHPDLPFGGIGTSGIGRSHGHHGFVTFSNERSVLVQNLKSPMLRRFYPPYTDVTRRLIGLLLRYLG